MGLRVRQGAYRGNMGFGVTGTDDAGRRIAIFVRTRAVAEALRAAIRRAAPQAEISRLILDERPE